MVSRPLAPAATLTDTSPMSPSNGERRYSEDEFALVLRMASEVEDVPDPGSDRIPDEGGFTLSQIREIAAEVGIDPERVSRAAALLPSAEESVWARLLGGHPRHRLQHSVSGEVAEKDLVRIIEVARNSLGVQGETREVLGALEWKGSNNVTGYSVSATPREGATTIQVSADRTESMMGIYGGVGMGVLGIVALTSVKLVFGETDAGIVAGLLTGIPPGLLAARALWKKSTKKWRRRLLQLMDALAEEAEASLRREGVPLGGVLPREGPGK